jgi:oligopeptidase B
VEHHGDRFLIRTNHEAENFKLVAAPVGSPGREAWQEILPHRKDTLLEGIDLFRDHLVAYERKEGLPQIRISSPDGRSGVHIDEKRPKRVRVPYPFRDNVEGICSTQGGGWNG